MNVKSIALLLHDFNAGGTEATALRLAGEWVAAGHRVTIVAGATDGPMHARVPDGVAVHILSPPVPRSALSRLRLGRAMVPVLRALAPDVGYITGNYHFWIAPAIRRALPHLPLVAKISNPLLPDLPPGLRGVARRLLARLTDAVNMFVAMSPELAEQSRRLLPGRPVRVAPEPNLPRDHRPAPRTVPERPPAILAIGRLEAQKDMALALRAFAALLPRRPARLTILGEGPERTKLEALARHLGVAEHVDMPGFVADVPERLARASVLLMTSRYEGFPAVPIEALAADVPVVATDCTPVLHHLLASPQRGQVVRDRNAAALAAALDAALDLPFQTHGVRASATAPYSAPASAAAYLAIFEEAITRPLVLPLSNTI